MEFFDINDFPERRRGNPLGRHREQCRCPGWLREAAASTDDQLSAAGIILKKYHDRPLESLDDRLRALRDAGLSVASTTEQLNSAACWKMFSPHRGDADPAQKIRHQRGHIGCCPARHSRTSEECRPAALTRGSSSAAK